MSKATPVGNPIYSLLPTEVEGFRPLAELALDNAYCQDNETNWYDWSCLEKHGGILAFTRGMIAFRRAHPILSKEQFYTDAEIQWLGPYGGSPNWSDPNAKQLACLIQEDQGNALYLMFNAWTESVDFALPALLPGTRWRLAFDTSGEAQQDLFAPGTEPLWEDPRTYHLRPRSSAILLARQTNTQERLVTMKDAK